MPDRGLPIINQIIRSDRKTISLIINELAELIVRAPNRVSLKAIEAFVAQKADWIAEKQAIARARMQSAPPPKRFQPGERILFLGEAYPLEVVDRLRPEIALEHGRFRISRAALPRAADWFEAWMRFQARRVIAERAAYYSARHGIAFSAIRVGAARTRWGSCSTTGTLSFTYRLVMAPLPVIDYVVVHELAHRVEHNHSRRFWAKVEEMMPAYRERQAWLKAHGAELTLA